MYDRIQETVHDITVPAGVRLYTRAMVFGGFETRPGRRPGRRRPSRSRRPRRSRSRIVGHFRRSLLPVRVSTAHGRFRAVKRFRTR